MVGKVQEFHRERRPVVGNLSLALVKVGQVAPNYLTPDLKLPTGAVTAGLGELFSAIPLSRAGVSST